jgi:hypothetical protein
MAGRRGAFETLLVATLAAAGCRGTPEPVVRSEPAAKTAAESPAAQPAPPSPEAAQPQEVEPTRDDTPVVVDPGGNDGSPVTLVEAARAERERRAKAGEPVAVITNQTLPQYARKGQITIADPKERTPAAETAGAARAGEPVRDEPYWRGRGLEIRQRWRQAADDVKELEQRSAALRQRFYLEDDTFTRDNQIKPEWDRVLDRLRQARLDVEAARKELAEFLDEGRAAGVVPGWLREGEEEEPEQEPARKETLPPAQSVEPPVLNEPPPPGRGGGR